MENFKKIFDKVMGTCTNDYETHGKVHNHVSHQGNITTSQLQMAEVGKIDNSKTCLWPRELEFLYIADWSMK